MAAKLAGYRREAGAARGYVGPGGERISYRRYRKLLEQSGAVERVSPAYLAVQRKRQREFNDIINQMAKVKRETLNRQIEYAEAHGQKRKAETLRKEIRTVKREAIKSPERKSAQHDIGPTTRRIRAARERGQIDFEAEQRAKQILETLGRRDGIPSWVPVGMSDDFRRGQFRRPQQLPRQFRGYNTRASK